MALDDWIKAGGWVFAAVVTAGGIAALFRALSSGTLVAGSLHLRTLDQNEKLTAAVTALTSSVERLTDRIDDLQGRRSRTGRTL